jgi:hypothetical protein
MGLIKKKTASRGTEGGVKYVCDVCSSDITSTVSCTCIDAHDRGHSLTHTPNPPSITIVLTFVGTHTLCQPYMPRIRPLRALLF